MVDIKINGQTYSGITGIEVAKADGTGNITLTEGSGSTLITKNITTNGTYNATDDNADGYSEVTVNVSSGPINSKTYTHTQASDVTSATAVTIMPADETIASHRTDNNLFVSMRHVEGFESKTSIQAIYSGNISYAGSYGVLLRSSASATAQAAVSKSLIDSGTTALTLYVDTDGSIKYNNSGTYPLRTGTYIVTISW